MHTCFQVYASPTVHMLRNTLDMQRSELHYPAGMGCSGLQPGNSSGAVLGRSGRNRALLRNADWTEKRHSFGRLQKTARRTSTSRDCGSSNSKLDLCLGLQVQQLPQPR